MKPATEYLQSSRRMPKNDKQSLLELNNDRSEAYWAGAPIELPELSFQFLASLASRGVQPTTYDDLMKEVWSGQAITQDTIKQRVKLVREALVKAGAEKDVIQTIRGVGYRLVLPEPQTRVFCIPKRYIAGALLLALLTASALLLFRSPSDTSEPAIAVMPLPVIGAQAEAGSASVIDAELLSALGRLQGIHLVSGQTMAALSDVRARDIYHETKASVLVEGSFRFEGETEIIDLRGVDAQSEIIVWSYRYVPDPSAPPGAARRIAQHASRYLQDAALMTQLANARVGGSRNMAARTDFLNALAPFYAGDEEGLLKARELLIASVEKDETFSTAQARLAEVYARLALRFDDESAAGPAIKHAELALNQTPDSALAHYSYGLALFADGENERALEELSVAVETLPFAERDLIAIQNRSKK